MVWYHESLFLKDFNTSTHTDRLTADNNMELFLRIIADDREAYISEDTVLANNEIYEIIFPLLRHVKELA